MVLAIAASPFKLGGIVERLEEWGVAVVVNQPVPART